MIVDELIAVLGYDVRGEEKLRSFNQSIEQVASRLTQFAAAAAVAAAGAMTLLSRSVIQVSAQFESLEASLTTVTGSVGQAKDAMAWIKQFARDTPYEVGEITDAFIKLKSYGIDPLADDALKTLGDTASAMNKPLNQAVEALADATTFEFERLKEFGLRAQQQGDQVTFSWTENGKQLSKTIRKNSEEVRKFVLEQLGDRFNGAMLRQSKTWNGMMSNLGDAWTAFLLKIGSGGFFEAVKSKLAQLLDYIGQLDQDGTLGRWADNLGKVFEVVANALSKIIVQIARDFGTLYDIFDRNREVFKVFGAALLGLAIGLFPMVAAFIAAGAVIDDFLTYLRGGDSVIGDAIKWLGELRDAILAWIGALPGRIANGITNAFRAGFEGARNVVIEFCDWATAKLSAINPLNLFKDGPADVNQPKVPYGALSRDPTAHSDALGNFNDNWAKTGSSRAAAAMNSTVNDNSNRSVNVDVGGVVVNGVSNVSGAVGAAVGQATGNGAAAGAKRATWHELGEKF